LKLKAFLAMMFVSILSSAGMISAAPDAGSTYRKFVIYYGWYLDSHGQMGPEVDRIIKYQPEYVVSPYHTSAGTVNLTPEVMDRFHAAGIKVLVYVATGNGDRKLDSVLAEMKTGFNAGADGAFLDEVAPLHYDWQYEHYKKIYNYAKPLGKLVVANPGTILVNERVMSVSDIVSFEHQWRLATHVDWFSKYPATRFMGISSNDIHNVMGYRVDGDTAARDTIEAWQSGIGYHFSTDAYTRLASWNDDYQEALLDYGVTGSQLHQVGVKTVDSDGNEIKGLWIEVKKAGRVVMTGFSPAKFMLPQGSYEVGAANYQSYVFSKWQDGDSSPYKRVSLTGPADLAATYKNERAGLKIESYDTQGNSIRGLYVSVNKDGQQVAGGYTPLSLSLPLGQYSISASSYKYYEFSRWDDRSAGDRQLSLAQDVQVSAYYASNLVTQIASDCDPRGYQEQVASSILQGGALGGALELHRQKSVMLSSGCAGQP
jgi:hypothetical protein